MARLALPWAFQTYSGRTRVAALERVVNLLPERNLTIQSNAGDATAFVLVGAPGSRPFCNLPDDDSDVVQLHSAGGHLFAWSREGFYDVTGGRCRLIEKRNNGKIIHAAHGTYLTDSGKRVFQVWWSDRRTGYIYDFDSGNVQKITDDSFLPVSSTTYLDGYAIWSLSGSDEFTWSEIKDYDEYNGLNFATAEGAPDNLLRVVAFEHELWMFGETSTEVWTNVGDQDAPFQRLGNAFLEVGCASGNTVAKLTRDLYWIGNDLRVYRTAAKSYRPIPISQHQNVEHDLHRYYTDGVDDAFAFGLSIEGHELYFLTLPKAKRTWVFDEANGAWSEFATMDNCKLPPWCDDTCEGRPYGVYMATCGVMHEGQPIIGSAGGSVYSLDMGYFLHDEQPIMREASTSPIQLATDEVSFERLEFEFQNSCGFLDSDCEQPGPRDSVLLHFTDSQGKKWCDAGKRWIVKDSEKYRPTWDALGRTRSRAFRWRTFYDGQVVFRRSIFYMGQSFDGR